MKITHSGAPDPIKMSDLTIGQWAIDDDGTYIACVSRWGESAYVAFDDGGLARVVVDPNDWSVSQILPAGTKITITI